MEKHKKTKTHKIKTLEKKNKYEIPLSLKTWEEKAEFLHKIHQEIQEKRDRGIIHQESDKEQ